ncbi:hypothetical protein QBC47DRAFT_383755 [Echria macrotheca]|uniref:Uncharacterized protein n=1 Tax=Echria macrotheca TaxID=438768 RepID=A0AAJ0B9W1_9PEZI|nr:hypothetical protein QBC47DRAFT_383755 [Echria macrotheca]
MDLQLQTGYQSYAYALDTGPHRDSTEEAMVFCWRKCDSFEIFDMEFRRKPKVMTAWKLVYESHNRPDTTEEDVAGVPGVADLVEDVSSVEEEVAAVEENVAAVVAFHRYSPFRPRATFKFLWKSKSGKYDELWAQFAAITWLAIFSQHLHIYNPIRLDVPEDGMFRFGLPSGVSLNLGTLGLNLDAFRGRHVTQYRVNGSPTERYEENSKSVSGGFSYAGGY